ncbi:MAG: type II pantothenate kinase [Myxococcota bacterium]|jgi:type II pantothenate kinase
MQAAVPEAGVGRGMDAVVNEVVHGEKPGTAPAASVGVDLGATLAKIAYVDAAGELLFESIPTAQIEALKLRIESLSPATIGLTGAGAVRLGEMLEAPSTRHDEFAAWGEGGRRLLIRDGSAHEERSLLVSIGTGTSVLLMDGATTTRVGGTALGGGTILGLASAILKTTDFEHVCRLAASGERAQVDLVVSDIYKPGEIALPNELTAASFGKLGLSLNDDQVHKPEHLAAAILGLVGENIGLICAGLSYATQVEQIVYAGSTLRNNTVLRNILESITMNAGRRPLFLSNGDFSGATGALFLSADC